MFRDNIQCSSWAHWKRVVDFLLVLIELLSLGVTAEELPANIGSKSVISLQRGLVNPKFQAARRRPYQPFFSQKTKLNDFLYGIKIWTDLSSVLVTIHAFDRQADTLTDGRTYRILIARLRLHSTQCSKKHKPHFSVFFCETQGS